MSEEEILKECTELAENEHHELGDCWDEEYSSSAIFGLIMLYKQTKKELNNLKEIEKSHQEENGKLRVELEQEKEKNKDLEEKLKIAKQLYNDACVCIATECVEKDKIKEIQGRLFVQLGSYVRNEASPEQERIAGGINIINEILEEK